MGIQEQDDGHSLQLHRGRTRIFLSLLAKQRGRTDKIREDSSHSSIQNLPRTVCGTQISASGRQGMDRVKGWGRIGLKCATNGAMKGE